MAVLMLAMVPVFLGLRRARAQTATTHVE
jgi:hypothetical protein